MGRLLSELGEQTDFGSANPSANTSPKLGALLIPDPLDVRSRAFFGACMECVKRILGHAFFGVKFCSVASRIVDEFSYIPGNKITPMPQNEKETAPGGCCLPRTFHLLDCSGVATWIDYRSITMAS